MSMQEMKLFIFLLTFLFLGLSFFFYKQVDKISDLRTLKSGTYLLSAYFSFLLGLNGILLFIASLSNPSKKTQNFFINFLHLEFLILVLPLVIIGSIVPILTVKFAMQRQRSKIEILINLLFPASMIFFLLVSVLYLLLKFLEFDWDFLKIAALTYPTLAAYIGCQFLLFYWSSWIYGRKMKPFEAKYFVVLGAGLINGNQVGPLLANRIKAALAEANEQTILVFSGGKGDDEQSTEAAAMQNYAFEEFSFPKERTLLEESSRNSYQNLLNSSSLINDKFKIFTSDFHVFRSVLLAEKLGLDAQAGKAGASSLSYRIPAFFREFIAYMNMERKKYITVVAIIIALFTFLSISSFFY